MSGVVDVLRLRNWGPFRGDHEIELGAGTFGVWARREGDPERSNWCGKTWLIGAIVMGLTGKPPKHPSRPGADAWITDGEAYGRVELVMGDLQITRHRSRGRATRLEVAGARQDEAQRLLEQRLGFSAEDVPSTVFLRQEDHSRLVLGDPSVRTEMVAGWLRLAPLRDAAADAGERLRAELKRRDEVRARLGQIERDRAELREAWQVPEGEDLVAAVEAELTVARDERADVAARLEAARRREETQAARERRARMAAELERLEAERPEGAARPVSDLEGEEQRAREALVLAKREAEQAGRIEQGFDGRCPVNGCDCPIADRINAEREPLAARARAAQAELERTRSVHDEARAALEQGRAAERRLSVHEGRVEALRQQLAELEPPAEPEAGGAADEAEAGGAALGEQLREVDEQIGTVEGDLERLARLAEREREARAELEGITAGVATLRAARAVLGPNGAQRDVAEASLGRVERSANGLLGGTGLELSVRWGRSAATGLAESCEECGAPHPRSQRIKACQECGAERGPKQVPRLDLVPTEFSGAANNMGGLAFQVAAAAWLRARRQAALSLLLIDEPHGSLDRANRRAVGRMLARVSELGFRQVIVISHSVDALEAMPRRIEVVAGPGGSRVAEVT